MHLDGIKLNLLLQVHLMLFSHLHVLSLLICMVPSICEFSNENNIVLLCVGVGVCMWDIVGVFVAYGWVGVYGGLCLLTLLKLPKHVMIIFHHIKVHQKNMLIITGGEVDLDNRKTKSVDQTDAHCKVYV